MRRNSKKLSPGRGLFSLMVKKPLLLIGVLIVTGCNVQNFLQTSDLSFKGLPQAQSALNPQTWHTTLKNQAFWVGYSEQRNNPLWVVYSLKPVPDDAPLLKRPTHFSADKRLKNPVKHDDYNKSGYDRGHLAPNYAISSLYGKEAQLETFLMTNISPQKPNLNRKLWQRLEEVEVKYFTQISAPVWVTTGTIFFDDKIETLKSAANVEIPDAFYKIYAMQSANQTYLLAFVMPQNVKGNEPLDRYLVTVDKVEELTGLDFFHELNDQEENALESTLNPAPWNLAAVSRLPGRY
jgi:endonuclease G, mitochondrial